MHALLICPFFISYSAMPTGWSMYCWTCDQCEHEHHERESKKSALLRAQQCHTPYVIHDTECAKMQVHSTDRLTFSMNLVISGCVLCCPIVALLV